MFTTEEKRKLLRNTKLHWVVKANAVKDYIDKYSFEKAIYDLGLNKKTIEEYWKLGKYIQFFPLLKDITDRKVALNVIKQHEGNSVEMRKAIAIMAVRFKSKLLRSAMTTKFKGDLN